MKVKDLVKTLNSTHYQLIKRIDEVNIEVLLDDVKTIPEIYMECVVNDVYRFRSDFIHIDGYGFEI